MRAFDFLIVACFLLPFLYLGILLFSEGKQIGEVFRGEETWGKTDRSGGKDNCDLEVFQDRRIYFQ